MNTLSILSLIIGAIIFGVILDRLWMYCKRDKLKGPINPLPTSIPVIDEHEHNLLQLYLQEWKVIIETQMHFNDLILRFRTITLTAFISMIGATIAIVKIVSLTKWDIFLIFLIPITLWLAAFIIDFGYYHRLLLGSVNEALKFDDSEKLKSYGLFGMTSNIIKHISPATSELLVILYYFVPLIIIVILLFWIFPILRCSY